MHGAGVKPSSVASANTEAYVTAASSESLAGKEKPEGVAQYDGKLSRSESADVPQPEETVPRSGGGDGEDIEQIVHDMPNEGKVETVMKAKDALAQRTSEQSTEHLTVISEDRQVATENQQAKDDEEIASEDSGNKF